MNSLVRILLAFALAVCAVTVPSAAHAQGASAPAPTTQAAKDEAQDRFKRGIELYEEENFAAALIEFKRAYELVPAYQVLYNVGRTCYQVRDYVCALRNFSRYLSEGGSAIDAKRKDEVDREIVSMRRRVATVSLTATRGSTISVDGVAIGDAPLATPLQVNEGRRLIRASMVGRESVDRSLEVVGGSTVTVDLTLAESAPSSAPVASTSKSSNTHWWLWGATGVLAVGAGVTGTLALSASGDASDIRSNGGSVSDYESAESRMRTLTVVTDVLALAAIGAGVTALVLTLTSDHQAPSSATAKARPAPGNGAFRFAF
jgi:hypothetical protein